MQESDLDAAFCLVRPRPSDRRQPDRLDEASAARRRWGGLKYLLDGGQGRRAITRGVRAAPGDVDGLTDSRVRRHRARRVADAASVGADVIRIESKGAGRGGSRPTHSRGRRVGGAD